MRVNRAWVRKLACGAFGLLFSPALLSSDSSATVRRGEVWRYTVDGVVHYTSVPRPTDPGAKLLFSFVEVTPGETWRSIAFSEDDTEYLVHTKSAKRSGVWATGWVMSNHAKEPVQTPMGKARSWSERWQVNCETMRKSITDEFIYSGPFATGKVVHNWSGTTQESSLMPGSIAEAVAQTLCLGPSRGADLEEAKP